MLTVVSSRLVILSTERCPVFHAFNSVWASAPRTSPTTPDLAQIDAGPARRYHSKSSNPLVRDRVNAVNAILCNNQGGEAAAGPTRKNRRGQPIRHERRGGIVARCRTKGRRLLSRPVLERAKPKLAEIRRRHKTARRGDQIVFWSTLASWDKHLLLEHVREKRFRRRPVGGVIAQVTEAETVAAGKAKDKTGRFGRGR
jgi:hypothetical protein